MSLSNDLLDMTFKSQATKSKINKWEDFLGDPVVKNPPSNAGDAGSIPGQGTKIPHSTG